MVKEYGDRVRFAVEDFGASPRADRFGIDKYPAIFVDEALVARPEDFYAWGGEGKGKYLPWNEVASRRKFQSDLRRMIEIRLAGGEVPSLTPATGGEAAPRPLPAIELVDLKGAKFRFDELQGKPILVEFWATWCPPCLQTLTWLRQVDGKANVVAIVVESEKKDIDRALAKFKPPGRVVLGTSEILAAFGGIPAVPTLILADGKGRIVRVFYGAPPDLHEQIQRELAKL